jgi:hypothetical protein
MMQAAPWLVLTVLAVSSVGCAGQARAAGEPAREPARTCLSPEETREVAATHKLAGPLAAQRTAAQHVRAEPLRSRLCRWNDEYVYEITLLRRDGKVMRVYVKAADGLIVGGNDNH